MRRSPTTFSMISGNSSASSAPGARRMPESLFHTVFFDVDSTLVTIEGIDVLAKGDPEIAEMTRQAMNGEIPVDQVYGRRLERIRPTRDDVSDVVALYIMSRVLGTREVVSTLLGLRVDVHLVTAGVEQAILPLAAELGIRERAVHAVRLDFDDAGRYAGFDRRSFLTRPGGKELVIRDIRARAKGKAAFVGDGITDAEARGAVDLFIGFGGVAIRDAVREVAPVYIT